jgi:uncharacterized protein
MSQLADALFTTTQQRVLGLLYTQPEKSFYTKEILRMTGMGVATIKRELDRMLAAGLLTFTKSGNQHHYQANPQCPIYEELLSIVRKTFGITDVVRTALEPIKDSIVYAFVYGSIAKGTEKAKSDIDLMLIGNNLSYGDVMGLLIPVEGKLGRSINPTIYSMREFKKKLGEKNSFLTRVLAQEKLIVMGAKDGIEES